ncbi:MAG: hypothetical protein M3R54_03670 [Chloroflexota bacterium]|nr:hypothetical protein [Chloroflexota bacterium]
MHASVLPTIWDIGGLIGYLFGNPMLFVSSTTVMTTGLILGAAVATALPQRAALLRHIAPTLALILAYFGLGSFALSLQILIRFHDSIPYETEVQFVSGVGHLIEAGIGLGLLAGYLRGHTARDWLTAHNVALAYWTFQIAVLTPPWFAFQGQREVITLAALAILAIAAAANAVLWRRTAH